MKKLNLIKCGICGHKVPNSMITTFISPLKIQINDKCTLTLHRGAAMCQFCKNKFLFNKK